MTETTGTSLLADDRPGRLGTLAGRLLALGYRLTGKARYDAFRRERVGTLSILVVPTVANPKALRTGAFFAGVLDEALIPAGARVLDLGTGSGVCALRAAQLGARVTAIDINPEAVRCAELNVLSHALSDRIDVRHGDLFEPVDGRFDRILFNPPFLRGRSGDPRAAAWYAGDLPQRFADGLRARLLPGGAALLVLSSFGAACPDYEAALVAAGFSLSVVTRRRFINETVTLIRAVPGDEVRAC